MVNIAMIGVGAISGIYLKNITGTFRGLRLLGVCDLIRERADAKKAKNFADADAIREKLSAMGVTLKDGKNTVEWTKE